jgi:hypothetical protein
MEKTQEYGEEIIHIIPLGHEIDRAVKPFEKYKANKAYLLAVTETLGKYSQDMINKQKFYVESVKNQLERKGIDTDVRNIDMFNTLEVIKHISNLIVQEKAKGNRVFVNISSAGRLTSVAATLAAMAHQVKAYYVVADGYSESEEDKKKHGLSSCRELRLQFLESLPFKLPKEEGMKVLVRLCMKEEAMKPADILEYLGSQKVEGFEKCVDMHSRRMLRKDKINCLMKLNKRILEKLQADGYISREKSGRDNRIRITPKGIYVAHISGELK